MDGLVEGARDLAISDNLEHSFQNAVKDDADLKRMTLKEFSLLSEGNIDVFFIPLTRTNAVLKAKLLLLRNLHLEKYSAVDSQVPPTPGNDQVYLTALLLSLSLCVCVFLIFC